MLQITKENLKIVLINGVENVITINGGIVELKLDSNICIVGYSMNFIEANIFSISINDFIEVLKEI